MTMLPDRKILAMHHSLSDSIATIQRRHCDRNKDAETDVWLGDGWLVTPAPPEPHLRPSWRVGGGRIATVEFRSKVKPRRAPQGISRVRHVWAYVIQRLQIFLTNFGKLFRTNSKLGVINTLYKLG